MFVLRHGHRRSLGTGYVDREHLIGARGRPGGGFLLRLEREPVLLLASDVVHVHQVLGRLAHDQAAQRVKQTVAVHPVDDLGVA